MSDADDLADALDSILGTNAEKQGVGGYLDTGVPELNKIMSGRHDGGVPYGRMVEIFGENSSGKCQPESTMVLGKHGLISFAELFELNGRKVTCTNRIEEHKYAMVNELGKLEETSHLTWNNRRKTKRIIGKNGYITEATKRHPLRVVTPTGEIVWRFAEDIKVGDFLPIMRNTQSFGDGDLTVDEASFIGYLVADGTLSRENVFGFTNSDQEIADHYCHIVTNVIGMKVRRSTHDPEQSPTYWTNNGKDGTNREFIRAKYGLEITKAAGKEIPFCVRTARKEVQVEFIRAYMECECCIVCNRAIEVCSASRKLLSDLQLMLLNLGMISKISNKEVNGVTYYRLYIRGGNYETYLRTVGFKTVARVEQHRKKNKGKAREDSFDVIPFANDLITLLYHSTTKTGRDDRHVMTRVAASKGVNYGLLKDVVDHFEGKENRFNRHIFSKIRGVLDDWLFYEEVVAIEDDEKPTFDVCMPETHSFWANGFISHNTFLATMMMTAAQKAGGIAGFSDHERSFEPEFAETIGLDRSTIKFRYCRPETFEESIALAMRFCEQIRKRKLIPSDAPLIWVFDSVASMIPHSKLYDDKGNRRDVGDYNMRDKLALASATSQAYPALAQFAEDYNMTVVLLNQIRLSPNVMFGDPRSVPGGKASEFYTSIRLSIGRKDIKDTTKEVVGFEIKAKTVKNKCSRPFQTATWKIRFNKNVGVTIDRIASTLDYCIRKGLVEKNGAWLKWGEKKYQQSQLEAMLNDAPDGMDQLMALLENAPESDD